jgi:DHA3 family macrolide efflux protein-like MFS transporter
VSTNSAADTSATPPQPMSMGAVLRIRMMRRLWFAQMISVFGDFLALFAVIGVLTFHVHATPAQVTGIQIAALLPVAILGVIAGVFVDRWPLKATMVGSDLARAALVLLLLWATELWQFYAVLAAISVVSSFFGPAQGVAIRFAVPAHGLRSANTLMQQVLFGMRIIGPALAAAIVASFGAITCYIVDSISFVGSAVLIASVAFLKPAAAPSSIGAAPSQAHPLARIWTDMQQGIGFIVHHAALLFVVLAMAAGMFVIGCFGPLIAVYVRDNLHASTQTFGLASALIGIGMFAGMNVITTWGKNLRNTTLVFSGLSGIAAGLTVLAILTHIWSTLLGNFVIGFAVAGIIVPSQTMIQQETPPALMGRVGSTFMSLIFGAQVSGLVLSGLLAGAVGVRTVFAVCALLLAIFIAVGRIWMEPKSAAKPAGVPTH